MQEDFLNLKQFSISHPIGSGGFSKVYRVKDEKSGEFFAAKVCNFMVDEDTKEDKETLSLFREVNLMSLLNHPSILKFIGYCPNNFDDDPCPTIITELAINGSLRNIIDMENASLSPEQWNDTKKLINIYGIASGMAYLHEHNLIHRDLKPENILMDEYLYPKISDFGLSKLIDFLSISMNAQSQSGLKGTPIYMAPEVFEEKYSKASDVYAFAFIVFEILTGETLQFKGTIFALMNKIAVQGYRPNIKEDVNEAYRKLIESCWSHSPDDRPSFEKIVNELKTNEDYITDLIDVAEFYDYIDYIDNSRISFEKENQLIHFEDFVKNNGRNKIIRKVKLYKEDKIQYQDNPLKINEKDETKIEENDNNKNSNENKIQYQDNPLKINEKNETKIEENDDEKNSNEKTLSKKTENQKIKEFDAKLSNKEINSIKDINSQNTKSQREEVFNARVQDLLQQLSENSQKLIQEAQNDPEKEFLVGKYLIEGFKDFRRNPSIGIEFIMKSKSKYCLNAIIYYIRLLIKGYHITQNIEEAKECFKQIDNSNDYRIYVINGLISKKENRLMDALKYFEKGANVKNPESMYKYAKMLFLGQGSQKNDKKALEFFELSKSFGYVKSYYFLKANQNLNYWKEFNQLPPETQYVFISNAIKNFINKTPDLQNENEIIYNKFKVSNKNIEMLFFNNSLKSPNLHKIMLNFKNITIEIVYPSKHFSSIFDLVSKIQKKKIKHIKIGIVLSNFDSDKSNIFKYKNISYYTIDPSINLGILNHIDGKLSTTIQQITIPSSVVAISGSLFRGFNSLTQITIPPSVSSIGGEAFDFCFSLTTVNIEASISSIEDCTFRECPKLSHISIPSSVTSIGNYAFSGCSSLTKIEMPNSVIKIGYYSFYKCSSLKEVTLSSSLTSINKYSFGLCSSLLKIEIPSSVKDIDKNAFFGCSSLEQITIPSTVTYFGNNAFFNCSSMKEFSIPPYIRTISYCNFKGCSSLVQISIPSSVTLIRNYAFDSCSLLEQIIIPSSVIEIQDNAFAGCISLKTILIPSSVNKMGIEIFSGCKSLKEVSIPFSITSIGNFVFNECSSLENIIIPSSITKIGEYAFNACSSLKQISIPSTVTFIGNGAFNNCKLLKKVIISPQTQIGEKVFPSGTKVKRE